MSASHYNSAMREWHLQREELPSLILAADARLSPLNYFDDQIWELHLRSGEPAALSLQTTYGLRARNMRLFPRFIEGDVAVSDPDEFRAPPAIHRFFPNYALITCSPFEGIDAILEYWVPFSNVITGRIRVLNSGVTPRNIGLEWVSILVPAGEGHRMTPEKIESVNVLQGRLEHLAPVVFMTGGAKALHSPYPSLRLEIDLLPGLDRQYTWVHAALADPQASFTLARTTAARDWDAEYARIELTNASQIEIQTGKPEWDLAFALGQKSALNLIHGPTEHLPHPSWVQTRLPDQGFSLKGDGTEYDHLWNGQSVLETWHLCDQLLPAYPDLAKGFLFNFLATQEESGFVDWKPGLNGKRSGFLATPLLGALAWRIYETDKDQKFLEDAFTPLLNFFNHWFDPEHDRDQDGIPEWDHPLQTGFEDNPLFAYWQPWSHGAPIWLFESPALNALLYREAKSLLKIARLLGRLGPVVDIELKLSRLRAALERGWDEKQAAYTYQDYETHTASPGQTLGERRGAGRIELRAQRFEQPARLLVRVHPGEEGEREITILVRGVDAREQATDEQITPEHLHWSMGIGTAVSKKAYKSLEMVEIDSPHGDMRVVISTVDYGFHDQTLLLPLWAGVPSAEKAEAMIKNHLLKPNRYWQSYGLSACVNPEKSAAEAAHICNSVWMSWNSLIGKGVVSYGHRQWAAELVSRLMDAVTQCLQVDGIFRRQYHAKTGKGIGERNALPGLPPLSLFLDVLGVRLMSPWKVGLVGKNPFPWPVKIRFRGLLVDRGLDSTEIVFPNEVTVTVTNPAPCIVKGRQE